MDAEQRFRTTLSKDGSRVYLPIPFDPDQIWGLKTKHCLTGTIDGKKIRGTLAKFGDGFGLPTGPVWLRDNSLAAGDSVEASLTPEGPQLDNIGADFALALAGNLKAKQFFEGLPTFYRKNYLRWIDSAKRSETRAKRVAEAVQLLADGVRR